MNDLYFEVQQKRAVKDIGVPVIQRFAGPGQFLTATGLPLTGAGDVKAGVATASGLPVVIWATTADQADLAVLPWTVPAEYARGVDRLELFLHVRKFDTDNDDTENADLTLDVQMRWLNPGDTAVKTLSAVLPKTLRPATNVIGDFRWYRYNLSLGITERAGETNRLLPLTDVKFEIGPNETVGSSNLLIEMRSAALLYHVHPAFHDEASRFGSLSNRLIPYTSTYVV